MAAKLPVLSDLLHRVACTCLNSPLTHGHGRHESSEAENCTEEEGTEEEDKTETATRRSSRTLEQAPASGDGDEEQIARAREGEALMEEVFQAVAALKKAYVGLQGAHSPWDPEKMSASDAAVVAELKRLGRLRDRFRRGWSGGEEGRLWAVTTPPPLREAVVPYEAAIEDLRRDLKVKDAELENLKERLRAFTAAVPPPPPRSSSGRKGRFHRSGSRVRCQSGLAVQVGKPTPELFRACMEEVRDASKSFTSSFLSLMRAARWDIAAAVRSILEASGGGGANISAEHAKHAMESYVNRKLFHGFESETFYLEGTLSSLLNPNQHRHDCYAQFRDMRGMDPSELLGVLPDCHFGRFAATKYLAMVHQKMEESLFGDQEQRRQIEAGLHPRTVFYGEFLRLAKAVWLLHLLAFSMDPAPSHFEARTGSEFNSSYMESVLRRRNGQVSAAGWVVGFPVAPGFKLADGSVVRARVFLVSKDPPIPKP